MEATRSRLRTVPLGRLARLFFMFRIVRLATHSATEKFDPVNALDALYCNAFPALHASLHEY